MFFVQEEIFDGLKAIRLQDDQSGAYVVILPELGGIINSYSVCKDGEYISVIDGYANLQDFKENNESAYKSNFLFPFPNRIRDGKYKFEGQSFQLALNKIDENNSLHGLVYDEVYDVLKVLESEEKCRVELGLQFKGKKGYERKAEIKLSYTFSEEGLLCEAAIENTGDELLPFGLGWHHYFTFEKDLKEVSLQMATKNSLTVDHQMIPTGEECVYTQFKELSPIGDTVFDTCFKLKDLEKQLVVLFHENLTIHLRFTTSDFPFLQVYTPPNRKTIAIEPMTCAPDAFNNGQGIRVLDPRERMLTKFLVHAF